MGQLNTERISHTLEDGPNVFRDDQLQQIINDLGEEDTGAGYSEVSYLSGQPFVDRIDIYDSPSKTKKRSEILLSYTGAFVTGIVKNFYDEETGTSIVARTTVTVVLNANKTINTVNVVNERL